MNPPSPTRPFSVRQATAADAGLVHDFIVELAAFEKLSHEVVATPTDLEAALARPEPHVGALLAEVGGQAVGYALYYETFSSFLGKTGLHLEDLFVRPEHRRRGIGRALLLALAQLAHDRQYGRVEWTVLDWNEGAIAFYRELGAAPLPDWRLCRLTGDSLAAAASLSRAGSGSRSR